MPFPQYNSPLQFPQESGVVEALQNDLTLRASTSGDVIISPNALRPEVDVAQDLGTNNLRWHTLHLGNLTATSGTFGVRPTISGIGFATLADITDTQITLNGLSGAISITSPDDTILIGDSPQAIELSGLFTQASGSVLEQHTADLVTLSGLIGGGGGGSGGSTSINGLSGVVFVSGVNLEVTTSGQTILVSGIMNAASGAILEQKCRDIDSVSGVAYSNSGILEQRIDERRWQGVISGLELSINSGNSGLYDVAAGVAYISGIRIVMPEQTGLDPQFLPGSGTECGQQIAFIGLNVDGSLDSSIDAIHTHDDQATLIDLGMLTAWDPASPNSGLIELSHTERQDVLNVDYNRISWIEFAVGAVVSSGVIVSDNGSLTLAVSDGVFYDRHQNRHLHELDAPLDFFEIYRGGDGVYRIQAETTLINNTQYDNGTGLTTMTGNRWASHSLWFDVIRDLHFMVISNDQYSSLQLAQDAPLNPGCIVDFANVIPIAQVVIQRNQTVIGGSTGRIIDRRPIIGARDAGGVLSTSATTLQQAYENSPAGAEIILQADQGGLTIADNATPLVNTGTHLFEVHNSDETAEYFQVNGSGIYAPSGIFEHKVGIGGAFPQGAEARCTLDVSGMICTSGLEIVGSRPTLSGVGMATLADIIDTQMTLNGLSGAVTLTSPDNTILIGSNGQAIELSGLFTPASGAVLEQKCADIDTLSGLILSDGGQTSINDESGVISLLGGDGITIVTTTEGSPGVPAEITISALFTAASGAVLQQKCEDIASVSGTVAGLPEKVTLEFTDTSGTSFVMYHGLSTLNFTWNMWEQDDGGNIQNYVLPATLRPSGVDYVEVGLSAAMVGTLIILG
tara:strand:+ start:1949 stop:4507 length:2559 start_codon:yes stop_codon:yes gene_type:complete